MEPDPVRETTGSKRAKRRRGVRIGLGVTMLLIASVGSWIADWRNRAVGQRSAVQALSRFTSGVYYDFELHSESDQPTKASLGRSLKVPPKSMKVAAPREIGSIEPPPAPYLIEELRKRMGLDAFHPVRGVFATGSAIDDVFIRHVTTLSGLRILALGHTPATDDDCARLSQLRRLRRLILYHTLVTDRGVARLEPLEHLEHLFLSFNTGISDRSIESLLRMRKLRAVEIAETSITDAGLMRLAKHPELEYVMVGSAQITDRGIEALARLPRLKRIAIGDYAKTGDGLERFRAQRPEVAILPGPVGLPAFQPTPRGR